MTDLREYQYGGARALVALHERQLRKFLVVWRHAKTAGLVLPECDDPNYVSLEALLAHVLRCARHYMVWMCEVLELPDPEIRPEPDPDEVEAEMEDYVEHLIERWQTPLRELTEEQATQPMHTAIWGIDYCIDSMLEHAVMHPLRHRFQLDELLAEARRGQAPASVS